jgi:hypothetical protein
LLAFWRCWSARISNQQNIRGDAVADHSKVQKLLRSNPTFKADLVRTVKDVLKKHGVEDHDLNLLTAANFAASENGGDFIISKSDGKKNDTTVYFP